MAGYRLAEFYLAFFPCFFYATFHYAQFICVSIYADTPVYGGCHIAILIVGSMGALFFYFGNIFRGAGKV